MSKELKLKKSYNGIKLKTQSDNKSILENNVLR